MNAPRVSVVLLCFERPEMLRKALASVEAQRYPNLEVLVISNRSERSSEIADVAGAHPAFRLIEMPCNAGFTGGVNRGIAEATGEYIHLTQEDIVLGEGCIEELVAAFDRDPSLDLACPLMIDAASGRIRSAGGWFRLDGIFRQADFAAGETPESFSRPREVTYIPGNMMFARAAFFRGFTGFRDDFFMYFEDVELCARAIRARKRVMVQPTAVVENLDPPSSAPSTPAAEFHKIKNLFAIYLLHGSAAVLPAFFLRYGFIAVLRSPFSASGRLRMKALLWIARNLPRLLADRRRARGLEATTLRTKLAEAV